MNKLFMQERGDTGLGKIDPNLPVYALSGILVDSQAHDHLCKQMDHLADRFWNDPARILTPDLFWNGNDRLGVLHQPGVGNAFVEARNKCLDEIPCHTLGIAIDKNGIARDYGMPGSDMFHQALLQILEQALMILRKNADTPVLSIVVKRKGSRKDRQLRDCIQRLGSEGTDRLDTAVFRQVSLAFIADLRYEAPRGLQLAGLAAYALAGKHTDANRANADFDRLLKKTSWM